MKKALSRWALRSDHDDPNGVMVEVGIPKKAMPASDCRNNSYKTATAWLLALSLFFATFNRATQPDTNLFYPPMSPIFDLIFEYGRYASVCFMVIAVAVANFAYGKLKYAMSGSILGLFMLNSFLIVKIGVYGHVMFFFLALSSLILQIIAFVFVTATISSRTRQSDFVAQVTFLYALLLVAVNLFVAYRFPESAWVLHGRLFGITSNAQHLGMATALCVPALIYYIRQGSFRRPVSIALLAGCTLIVYFTGSRAAAAGMLLAIIIPLLSAIVTGRRRFLAVTVTSCLVLAATITELATSLLHARFFEDRQDTRSVHWRAAFEEFLSNPLFGVELSGESGRFMFTVNTWLAAASSGGVIAVGCSLLILGSIATAMIGAIRHERQSRAGNTAAMFISAAMMIIWFSLFEALFLGIFAAHTMMLIAWLGGLHNMVHNVAQSHQKPVFAAALRRNDALYTNKRQASTNDA